MIAARRDTARFGSGTPIALSPDPKKFLPAAARREAPILLAGKHRRSRHCAFDLNVLGMPVAVGT
jgi:hypothetical protein